MVHTHTTSGRQLYFLLTQRKIRFTVYSNCGVVHVLSSRSWAAAHSRRPYIRKGRGHLVATSLSRPGASSCHGVSSLRV